MSFYINDFKHHLQTLADTVERTDHTEPKRKPAVSLEEQYSQMQNPMAFAKKKKEEEEGVPTLGKDAGIDAEGKKERFSSNPMNMDKDQFMDMMAKKGINKDEIEEKMRELKRRVLSQQ